MVGLDNSVTLKCLAAAPVTVVRAGTHLQEALAQGASTSLQPRDAFWVHKSSYCFVLVNNAGVASGQWPGRVVEQYQRAAPEAQRLIRLLLLLGNRQTAHGLPSDVMHRVISFVPLPPRRGALVWALRTGGVMQTGALGRALRRGAEIC